MPKLVNLNVVNVDTNYSVAPAQAGFNTVALLNNDSSASQPKLEKYSALNQMTDYDPNSAVYKTAAQYFNNQNSTLFEVISGKENSGQALPSASNGKAAEINQIINAAKHDSKFNNNVAASGDYFSDTNFFNNDSIHNKLSNDFGFRFNAIRVRGGVISTPPTVQPNASPHNGLVGVINYLKHYAQNHSINLDQSSSSSQSSGNGLVDALEKYYNSGAEYFLFNVDNSNQNDQKTALKLAQEVEDQSSGVLMIDINTDNAQPDLSWTKPMASDKSVMVVSLPNSNDFGAALLSVRANQSPNANIEMVHSLNGIKPQDAYSFTVSDYEKYYAPFNVATYAYRNGIPMLTSGDSDSGYQWSNMITRDYTNYQIINRITAILVKNNGDPGVPYNQQGIHLIQDQLRLVLSAEQRNNLIGGYGIGTININKIPQSEIAKGQLNGLSYNWSPMNNITGVTFHQQINMPNLNA